jgi:hypothetical protein
MLVLTLSDTTYAQDHVKPNQSPPDCTAVADPTARLACYDAANSINPSSGTEQSSHWPEFGSRSASDTLKKQQIPTPSHISGPTRGNPLRARVIKFEFSHSSRFTITLDDGQVWRQLASDDGEAQFNEGRKDNYVVISRGFLRSYDLKLNDRSYVFKVERIR